MPDCVVGDSATVGAVRVHGTVMLCVAVPLPAPLSVPVAVTDTVLLPDALALDVLASVDVVDAPDASVTDDGVITPDHPAGTPPASANVCDAQPVSRLVIVAVKLTVAPAVPEPVLGDSETVGVMRVHVTS
jgi:hypothetical protein